MTVIFSDDEDVENLHRDLYDGKMASSSGTEVKMFGMFAISNKIDAPKENVLSRTLVDLRKEEEFGCSKTFELKKNADVNFFSSRENVQDEKKTSITQVKLQRENLLNKWGLENKTSSPAVNRKRKSEDCLLNQEKRRSRRIQIESSSSSSEEEEVEGK